MEMKVQTQSNTSTASTKTTSAKEASSAAQQVREGKQTDKAAPSFGETLRNVSSGETTQKEQVGSSEQEAIENLLSGIPAELIALLFPQPTDSTSATPLISALLGQTDAATNPEIESEAWDKITEVVESPEGQAWLSQAINLLSAMGYLASTVQPTTDVSTGESMDSAVTNNLLQVQQVATAKVQLQEVLAGLLKATQEEPDSLLTGQVVEGLARLLTEPQAGGKGIGELDVRKQNVVKGTTRSDRPVINIDSKDNLEVFVNAEAPKSDKHVKALEMLAYKSGYSVERSLVLDQEESVSVNTNSTNATVQTQTGLQELPKVSTNILVDSKTVVAVNIREFTETMTDLVVKNMKSDALTGLSEARIILRPEHLGQVDIRISLQNGQLVAHFTAQQAFGKEAIENQMAQLRTNLQSQGFQVERLEVTQSPSLQSSMFQDTRHQQSSHQSSESNHNNEYHEGEEEAFTTETIEMDQLRRAASGATVDVTA